ncbi:hypothetical protein FZC35_02525 [Candidatus Cytomitobacter indipagum]|uniref:ImpA N-terminal domain-containing protein n=1 Tax=Candidatus Cytomitobacter indipagum TaxID=2601575 RepID=A0A5C0UET3_9PROT|nr:type VI secretion system ImpA family N-terminal domain-containing protein [Candidatus Cytomitobacter indipagum]QEK38227.1 hypothetical protein FZC35_02525 [Candidatus Cytomitobacter indipagum]
MFKIIDIKENLIDPIDNIRGTNLFVQLETLVEQKHDNLPKGAWGSAKQKDWTTIRNLCLDILVKHKKDLQVMVWLVEANLYLKQDLQISLEMFDFIMINHCNDQDSLQKAANYLDKVLCKMMPDNLTLCGSGDNKYALSDFYKNIAPSYCSELLDDEARIILDLINIIKSIISHCEKKNLKMSKVSKIINDFQNQKDKLSISESIVHEVKNESSDEIKSREHAYSLIRDITKYLKKHDPHSATPYLLHKAVEWENKSFAEILNEFNDPAIINKIFQQN